MSTILGVYEGPLAIFSIGESATYVMPPENTLEAKRQAAIAKAAAATLASPGAAAHLDYDGRSVAEVLSQLLYSGVSITGMTVTPSLIERGVSANVTVEWTIAGTITGQTLDGAAVPINDRAKVFLAQSVSRTWALAIVDAAAPGGAAGNNRTASLTVLPRRFWGVADAAQLNSAGVIALAGSELSASRQKTFAADGGSGAGKYFYFAYLAELGAPSLYKIFGAGETPIATTVSVTTAAGLTADYVVLRSPEKIIGSATVEVQ
jgi:hypothetical protein